MIWFIFISILVASFIACLIFLTIKLLSTKTRVFLINSFCYIQGKNPVWVRDPSLVHQILAASDSKGTVIEYILSANGWLPILSLESLSGGVPGDQWNRMKKSFQILYTHSPPQEKLTQITKDIVERHLASGEIIDSQNLVRILLTCLIEWLFEIPFKPEWEFVCDGTWEWRKEIALKNKADVNLKLRVIAWIKDLIRSSKYNDIFGDDKWDDPEFYSLILQPLVISPVINITDIAVTLESKHFQDKLIKIGHPIPEDRSQPLNDHIVFAINSSHPFPVLERWLPNGFKNSKGELVLKPNTQAFLPMDEIGETFAEFGKQHYWMAFGAGKRGCPGRDIAMAICQPLFSRILGHPSFKPELNHKFSGRNNDGKENFSDTIWQFKFLSRIIFNLLKQRISSLMGF